MKLLEYCYVISNNVTKLNQLYKWFDTVKLPHPILFKATDNCDKSHYELVKYAKQLKLPYITIFEDDAYPHIDVLNKLVVCEEQLNKNWNDIALIQLGCNGFVGWNNIALSNCFSYNEYFYVNIMTCPGAYAIFLKADSYDCRLKSLQTCSITKGYNYMKKCHIKYNYADRYSFEQFKKLPLIVKDNIFAHRDIILNKDR